MDPPGQEEVVTANVRWWLPRAWSMLLAALMLGPALGTGFVLTYDMVWVPDLALRPDFLGLGSGLPRAVPSDAVVAVLDEVLPGMVLQKLVLAGCLVLGGWGAVRLAPDGSTVGQVVAVTVYQWNPFVAERLLLGHWPVLVGYAALPWVVPAARALRESGKIPAGLWLLVPLGSLSATAGLVTAVTLLAFGWRRGAIRVQTQLVLLVAGANAPWVVAGLLHGSAATTDGAAAGFFALSDTGGVPGPVAALGLGGIWNAEVVLPSRTGALGVVWLVVLGALVAVGARSWLAGTARRDVVGHLLCWGTGFALAVMTWRSTAPVVWLMSEVPGFALLRDGARVLGLCAVGLTAVVAHGAAVLSARAALPVARGGLGVALGLWPLAVMPDAALGLSGRLDPATFPEAYAETRAVVADESRTGDVLVLPFTSYRAPEWNHRHKVLDPLGRYLTRDYVANDELSVSGTVLAGEDPRAGEVAEALDAPDARSRADALAGLGVGVLVEDTSAPGKPPSVAGTEVLRTGQTSVVALQEVRPRAVPASWGWAMGVAWTLFVAVVGTGLVSAIGVFRHVTRRSPRC